MVGRRGEPSQITNICARHDRWEFRIPSHVFRLVFKPTNTCDGVEAQRVFLYKRPIFKTLLVDFYDRLHLVFHRCEEEGFQTVKIVDDGIRHGVDGSEDVFPCLCGFLDINMRESSESTGRRLGKGEHGIEDRGCER